MANVFIEPVGPNKPPILSIGNISRISHLIAFAAPMVREVIRRTGVLTLSFLRAAKSMLLGLIIFESKSSEETSKDSL